MSTVVKAKVWSLLDRAEDPAETLDCSYENQLEQLQNVKQGIADLVTAKKRLQMQESGVQQRISKLDGQALQAMPLGRRTWRDRLGRAAIVSRAACSADARAGEAGAKRRPSIQPAFAQRCVTGRPRRRSISLAREGLPRSLAESEAGLIATVRGSSRAAPTRCQRS